MADDMSYFKNDPEVFSKPNLSLKAKDTNEEEPNDIIENKTGKETPICANGSSNFLPDDVTRTLREETRTQMIRWKNNFARGIRENLHEFLNIP